jgi:long-subunit acyl-CoA synthetase (AMP-forming)
VEAANKCSPYLKSALLGNNDPVVQTTAGSKTIWDMVSHAFKEHADRPAAGCRTLLKRDWVEEGGKKFEKLTLSETYTWMTYKELGQRVGRFATGLIGWMGLKKGDNVLIFAETQRDWQSAAFACFRHGAIVVTAYATLGEEGVSTALNQTGASLCICDAKLFKVVKQTASQCPGLKYVVPILDATSELTPEAMAEQLGNGIAVKSFEEVVEMGQEVVPPTPPAPSDVAIVMYTSGTTGASKGVILSHTNIVAQSGSGEAALNQVDKDTVLLGYLPLAHIFELFVEIHVYHVGGKIGYGSPHTLIDSSVKLAPGQKGDAPTLQPTLMIFAPAVLDKVYGGVKRKMEARGGLVKTLFDWGITNGYKNYDKGEVGTNFFFNSIIMKKVQASLGGNVTLMYSGSAPLSAEIQKFCQSVFNCPVRQGYGLSETTAATCIAEVHDNTCGIVGPPCPGSYIRLRDWEEGGYTNADLNNPEIGKRRGEVLIGGPTVALGYLIDKKNPDPEIEKKNKEDFVTIGDMRYFCTGDVGEVDDMGRLKIVDRKKDLFKGENGEYVSLGKVESILKLCGYVEMPMAYGKTGAKNIIALIAPVPGAIVKFAREQKLDDADDVYKLCKNPQVITEVSKACLKECKAGGLNGFEIPAAIALCSAPDGTAAWTPENDLLTSTMKLKRPPIAKAFAAEIDDAYSRAK